MPEKLYAYLFSYNNDVGTYDEVKQVVDSCPDIVNWWKALPNSFFIVSPKTASQLTTLIRNATANKGCFFIVDCQSDRNGWMPKGFWEWIRTPTRAK